MPLSVIYRPCPWQTNGLKELAARFQRAKSGLTWTITHQGTLNTFHGQNHKYCMYLLFSWKVYVLTKFYISSFTSAHFKISLLCLAFDSLSDLLVQSVTWMTWNSDDYRDEGRRPNTLMVPELMLPQIMVRFSHWSWLLLLTNDTNIWPSENILIVKLINGNDVIWQIYVYRKLLGSILGIPDMSRDHSSRWKGSEQKVFI